MRKLLTIFFFLILSFSAKATNFCFSVTGNDITGTGTIANPYQTLTKLSAVWASASCNPGDNFLLKAGQIFYGTITPGKSGTAAARINLGRYGTGVDPIVTGFTTIGGWTETFAGSHLWVSSTITGGLSTMEMVTVAGIQFAQGRYPNGDVVANAGYNTIDAHNASLSITDAALPVSPVFTNGELVLRVRRFVLSRNKITGHSGTTLTYNTSTSTDPINLFGYFVQNHINTLDKQWEWYYDPATKRITIYSGAIPNVVIKGATVNNLINSSSKSYWTASNITFSGSNGNAINITGGTAAREVIVKNCSIENAGVSGILMNGTQDQLLTTTIKKCNDLAIVNTYGADYIVIRDCTIDSIGLIKGAGTSGFGAYCGVLTRSKGTTIENCTLKHIGYDGILFMEYDDYNFHNNYIDSFCMTLDDGGAFYTVNTKVGYNSTLDTGRNVNRRIIGNTISNGVGAPLGTWDYPSTLTYPAEGVYFDNNSAGGIIDSNNISGVDKAIFIHHSNHITARYNTTFNNRSYALQKERRAASPPGNGDAINNNIFVNKTALQRSYYFVSDANNIPTLGVINNNHFANLSTQATMFRVGSPAVNAVQSLAQWRTFSGYDVASTQKIYLVSDTVRYVVNPTSVPLAVNLTSQGSSYNWSDIFGTNYTTLALAPYTSKVLFRGSIAAGAIPPVASISFTSILCNGGTSTITVSASSGTPPYTNTGTFIQPAGSYTYIVSDANNLKDTVSATITQPTLETLSENHTAILVNGGTSTVTFTSTGGTGSKQYKIGAGAYQGSNVFSGVIAGNYVGSVKDANNCVITLNFSITQPASVNGTASVGTISCYGGTTTVTVSASGGTAPYTGTGTFTGVSAGNHSYPIMDNVGAKDTVFVTISQPALLTLTENHTVITIYGNSSTVTLTGAGGTGAKTYKIDSLNYQASNVFTLRSGNYTAYVKDANGCITNIDFTITQPSEFIGAVSVTDSILCNGGSTTVTVAASGGIAPYTGLGTFTVSAGNYSYPLSDAAGATATVNITVTEPSVLTLSEGHTAILAYGGTSTVTLTSGGGTGIDSFSLGSSAYQASNIFSGIFGGTITGTVKDANGCITTINFTISQPSPSNPPSASEIHGSIPCFGGTASVTISASGGVAPITGTGVFSQSAGTTSYVVTGNNGEKDTVDVTLTQPAALTLVGFYSAISTFGGTTTVTFTTSGGTGIDSFNIGGAYQLSNVFAGVTAGTYTATVKDANGCSTSINFTIVEPSAAPPTATAQYDSILFYSGSTTVNINGVNGLPPYAGAGAFTRTAGIWSFTITDSAGISASVSVNITQPSPLTLFATVSSTDVTLISGGGVGVDSFSLNNGPYQSSNVFTGLTTGYYTATVKDANGATTTINFTFGTPPVLLRSNYKLKYP